MNICPECGLLDRHASWCIEHPMHPSRGHIIPNEYEGETSAPDVRECPGCEDAENAPHASDCPKARTPYDTGARLEPCPWVAPTVAADRHRAAQIDPDRFGRVDFDADGETIATVYAERTEGGGYVLDVYAHYYDGVTVRESAEDANAEIRAALSGYLDAMGAFAEACDEEEKSGQEKPAEAYWNRDDAAVEFATVAARWIAARLGMEA